MNENVAQLGKRVMARRRELGLSQVDVWQAGGPSNSTLTGIENGSAESVSASTLRKLDGALQWQAGSAAAALNGGEPTPIPSFDTHKAMPRSVDEIATREIEEKLQLLISQTDQLIEDVGEAVGGESDLYRQAHEVHNTAVAVGTEFLGGRDKVWNDAVKLMRSVGGALSGPANMAHALNVMLTAKLTVDSFRRSTGFDIAQAALPRAREAADDERQSDYGLARRRGAGKSRGQQIRDEQDESSD